MVIINVTGKGGVRAKLTRCGDGWRIEFEDGSVYHAAREWPWTNHASDCIARMSIQLHFHRLGHVSAP